MSGGKIPQALDFQCAIITGAAGGLGKAMAEYLYLEAGKQVILVGRTESTLQAASRELSSKRGDGTTAGQGVPDVPYYILDTGKVADIPAFVERVTKDHPQVDCLINNAGVQRELHVTDLELDKLDEEIDINIRGPIHLATALLPYFKTKAGAVIMNVTSTLAFVPVSLINPGYNGTKAYMHFFSMAQREQLKDTHVRVIEIAPPAVGTDLHRDREDPDDNKKHKNPIALTIEEFMKELVQGWKEDKDLISAGPGVKITQTWQDTFGGMFKERTGNYKPKHSW